MPTRPQTHRARSVGTYDARAAYEHRRRRDPSLAAAAKVRSSGAWAACRKAFRTAHPLCCDPLKLHADRAEPTQAVHHIRGLAQDASHRNATSFDNLAPLCTACHARIEAMERAGRSTAHHFDAFQQERRRDGRDEPRLG